MITLYDYQEKLNNEAATKFASGIKKLLAQAPTGSGKTVMFSSVCNRWLTKNTSSILILVHRIELLRQTRRTLYDLYKIKAQPIISGMKHIPPAQVYVGMIESTYKKVDKIPTSLGLVIIDEAHLANFFKVHKPLEALPNPPYILGFTATPYSANKKKPLKDYYQDIITTVQIEELIRRGKLCQNITRAPEETVNRAELATKGGDFDEGLMGIKFSAPKYVNNTVKAYEKYAPGTKAIVFNCTVDHSIQVNNAFRLAGYEAKHVDGDMSTTERTNILKWFESTPGAILNNVGIATTGTDIPSIQTVIMNRSTKSNITWLQCTGRGGRLHASKAIFTIIDMGGNAAVLGDWSDDRDWENIFHNPPKKKDKQGAAPCKSCPSCDAILAATARSCKYCGFEFPSREQEIEEELGDFVVVTKGLDIETLMQENSERKEYYTFFDIGRQLAAAAKQTVPKMTEEIAAYILSQYEEKGKVWCEQVGKNWNRWHQDRAKETLWKELQDRFKKWKPEGQEVQAFTAPLPAPPPPPPVILPEPAKPQPWQPSIQPLQALRAL
ncbi:Superfamily II DNA or RNA helicase [Arachidicoccus rhizosphaerae]|uniref:Superfamily II DNA or RNA helicase n=1 Tax=Arachidicoccus rhizosphaerae TaxID=551991 RepID=A0A1H4CGZ5_9BACT|nr:DEAD/DEAH box helicase [Arachidicoccus rhizosphaerae]SEA59610.1 Superfamily II DNA or RNA helicase [Arachidicoccus rhizosphaerae]